MKATQNQILEAIKKTGGIVKNICFQLGISRQAFYERIKKNDELQNALLSARDEMIDLGEEKLIDLVEKGNPNAVFFILKTLGKNRGYVEKSEVENTNKTINIIEVPELSAYEPTIEDIKSEH